MAPPPEATEPSPEDRYVSTAQVAKALGVSVTTVKRWVDEKILPAHKTVGGHRKLVVADVIRLVRETNLPHADLSGLLPKSPKTDLDPASVLEQLNEAFLTADAESIRTIVLGAYFQGCPVEVLADRVLSPAMVRVGQLWQNGTIDVMHEHRITQAVLTAIHEMKSRLRNRISQDRPVAVGGAPEYDHYFLSTALVGMSLLDAGWDAIDLGPHTPFSAFRNALDELRPRLMWLSVSHLQDADQFLSEYREFYKYAESQGVFVAVGGRGLPDSVRTKMLYTTYGDGLSQLLSFARQIHRPPTRPKRGRPPLAPADDPSSSAVKPDTDSEPDSPDPEAPTL